MVVGVEFSQKSTRVVYLRHIQLRRIDCLQSLMKVGRLTVTCRDGLRASVLVIIQEPKVKTDNWPIMPVKAGKSTILRSRSK